MNYAELYDVKSNEIDFYEAIKRWKKSGMKVKHLDDFIKKLYGKVKFGIKEDFN